MHKIVRNNVEISELGNRFGSALVMNLIRSFKVCFSKHGNFSNFSVIFQKGLHEGKLELFLCDMQMLS